ncbi:MAG: o-succinylbenzoate synthase [Cytophagaceae bacterium]|nr:o-succinylbenzoate synthase [Cytophagaceae bacterium]
MPLHVDYFKHTLDFRFPAGTSRGVLTYHDAYFLKVTANEQDTGRSDEPGTQSSEVFGLGEASPLPGLSVDYPDFEANLQKVCSLFNKLDLEVFSWNLNLLVDQLVDKRLPCLRFGLETALLDLLNGGRRVVFDNDFTRGNRQLAINGLVWMGDRAAMLRQVEEKLAAGYTTLKMKVGAIDFDEECRLIESIRNRFSPERVALRIDANGAWSPDDAPRKLRELSRFGLHSIEQPIQARQPEAMSELCRTSPIPVALDEELVGLNDYVEKFRLVKQLAPAYLILKPTLLGGFYSCREWIEIANRLQCKWWLTSALESNVGLSAIGQFAAEFNNPLPQGLGTGQLYHNNIPAPLRVEGGQLRYQLTQPWDLSRVEAGFA